MEKALLQQISQRILKFGIKRVDKGKLSQQKK